MHVRSSIFTYILLPLFLFFLIPDEGMAKKWKSDLYDKPELADSILSKVISSASSYEKIVEDYKADLYIKGKMNMLKRNHLIKFVPSMFKLQKNVKEYIIESVNSIHYTSPHIYDIKVRAVSGTTPRYKGVPSEMLEYFNMNIYSSTLLGDKLLSPLAKNGRKHYRYLLDSLVSTPDDGLCYKVQIIPRVKSDQLVESGYILISDSLWTVKEIYLEGKVEFVRFKLKVSMGQEGKETFLPKRFDLDVMFRFIGNKLDASYTALLDYNEITLSDAATSRFRKHNSKYNMTESFILKCDSSTLFSDSVLFSILRPESLSTHEEQIYRDYIIRQDTLVRNFQPKKRSQVFFGQLGDVLLSSHTVDFSRFGSVRSSPLINPLLLSYSPSNGFSYRQEFKYNRLFRNDRLLRVVPKIGYNFTRKEFYWSVNSDFYYWPQKRASLHVEFGNGNRIYSSDVLDDIKSTPDSIFDFDKIKLEYFKDLYFYFSHDIEVFNGFNIGVGFTAHRRTPVNKPVLIPKAPFLEGQGEEVMDKIKDAYISFAPHIRLSWTPGLYYYMSGKRKINLRSSYPTFILDWERGIHGVFNSTGEYERWEVDMQHQIRLGLMRSIYYRAGLGMFTNQKETYFVDFTNFTRNNLPIGWNDDIGGVFQLLDGRWYNSSDRYLRGHITFESPFLILPHLMKYTGLIRNERLYLNVLVVPHLTPYIELGYGIGTHIFDLGVFVNNVNGRFSKVGCKFTFELFTK